MRRPHGLLPTVLLASEVWHKRLQERVYSMGWKMKRLVAVVFMILFCLATRATPGLAQQRGPFLVDYAVAEAVVARWQNERNTFVDPAIIQDVFGSLRGFRETFCDGQYRVRCEQEVLTETSLRRIVGAHLDDATARDKRRITMLISLFAGALGVPLKASGWTDVPLFNRYAAVALPPVPDGSVLHYVHWSGPERLKPAIQRAMLTLGKHTFAVTDSDGHLQDVVEIEVYLADGGPRAMARTTHPAASSSEVPFALKAASIEPEVQRFALDTPPDLRDPRQRDPGRDGPPVEQASPFHQAIAIQINLIADATQCPSDCRARMGNALVQAFLEWRSGCTRCLPSTLKVIEVDGARYVEGSLVDWFNYRTGAPAPSPASPNQPIEAMGWMNLMTQRVGPLVTSPGFRRVDPGDAVLQSACQGDQSFDPGRNRFFPAVDRRVLYRICQPQATCSALDGCIEIPVYVGGNPCANVACGEPDGAITLNTDNYNFRLAKVTDAEGGSDGYGTIGRGADRVPLMAVLLHEVGHWFGLDHIDGSPLVNRAGCENVMCPSIGRIDRFRVTQGNLNMLNNAVDRVWNYRLVTAEAIEYEQN
jgi:hypothetical protein